MLAGQAQQAPGVAEDQGGHGSRSGGTQDVTATRLPLAFAVAEIQRIRP